MAVKVTQKEVAQLIRARQLLKEKGLSKDSDIKAICEAAGISRKTGYQWASSVKSTNEEEAGLREELTSALSDFSQKLAAIAPFLPSYLFYEPVKSILLDDGKITTLYCELIYLLLVGLVTFIFSYLLMKKRWLM